MTPPAAARGPSLLLSTGVVALLAVIWGGVRLFLFPESVLPLTFVLPLLVCIWSRRPWHLWVMAAVFSTMAGVKAFWLLPSPEWNGLERWGYYGATEANIVIGALAVRLIMRYRQRLEERNALVVAQNAELEAQAEELAQQNEEIKAQAEELAQQNEEIESQAEELARQNEELQATNDRLVGREEVLEGLLQTSRSPEQAQQALQDTCARARAIVGEPADAVAILELQGDELRLQAESGAPALPALWPLAGSLARTVLREGRTAYAFDFQERPDLAAPFGPQGTYRSLLVAPLQYGAVRGVIAACSRRPGHWTQEQFRRLEWISGQCALMLEGLRWQSRLAERTRELEAANRAKNQFLAMLSHELRTPLTPVLAAAGALANDARLPGDARDTLGMIRRNVNIQSRLIDDLLDLTRIERGKLELSAETLDVSELLRETAAIVAADLDAKEQALTLTVDLPAGSAIRGDGPRLQQVFWNLLRNAIKFSPPRSRVMLAAIAMPAPAARLLVSVTDQGVGLAAADLERIFLPFEQAEHAPRRASGSGLGLGLAIAKAIVELHDGAIRAVSAGLGQGCSFMVELPLVAAADAPRARSVHPGLAATENPGASWRILLVEDHVDTGRVISWLLKTAGHEVTLATSAADALERASAAEFDLVISDLGLPDESGLILMPKLRAQRAGLRGLCMSGYGMEDDVLACRDAGFDEHLTKPVDVQQLHLAIGRVMSRQPR